MIDVAIRPISSSDTENVVIWRNNPNVRKFFINQSLITVQSHMEWLNNFVSTKKVYQFIIENKTENKDVGSIYLRDVDLVHQTAEYGIFIGEDDQRGKGIAYLASKLILDFGFGQLNLKQIILRVLKENTIAIKSYERIGFRQGIKDETIEYINDEPHEVIFMDILKEDYSK